jgi:hypothetical protein
LWQALYISLLHGAVAVEPPAWWECRLVLPPGAHAALRCAPVVLGSTRRPDG